MDNVRGTMLIVSSLIVSLTANFLCRRFEPIPPIWVGSCPLVQMESRNIKRSSNIRLNCFKSSGFTVKA